ncbi:MAG: hypothetical protein M3H12_15885, partial [Chromatiales bacterium]
MPKVKQGWKGGPPRRRSTRSIRRPARLRDDSASSDSDADPASLRALNTHLQRQLQELHTQLSEARSRGTPST